MLQIAICDDMPEHAERLEAMIRQEKIAEDCLIERYSDQNALIERIRAPFHYDIVFLDIDLVGESGIDVAKRVNALLPQTQIIFVSAYLSLAVDIFDAAHVYFLMKPVVPVRLRSALERALNNIRALSGKQILLPVRGNASIILNLADIIYFERMRRTTVICIKGGSSETTLKLDELESRLPEGAFARPHNSYLVNLAYVKKIERFCLHLESGEILPVSNLRRPVFKQALTTYIEF